MILKMIRNREQYETVMWKNEKSRVLLCMLIPALAYVIIFCYLPMSGIVLAFKDFKYTLGIFKSQWCGWSNFQYLFVSGKYGALQEIRCYII